MVRNRRKTIGRSRANGTTSDRPIRAALYSRVSSDEQTKNWSLPAQKKTGSDFCSAKNWELVDIYVDEGHSAWGEKAETRPEYLRLMAAVEEGRYDVVITHSFDRMSRDMLNMFRTIKTFETYDVSFVSIQENIDFSGPFGPVLMGLFSALAQMQSTSISYHAKKGMRERKLNGLPHGRPPLGYQRCDDSCRGTGEDHPYWHIVNDEAILVREAFDLYAGRYLSMAKIADILNSRSTESDSRFTHDRISSMLRNCHYAGLLLIDAGDDYDYVPGVQVPIVDRSVFDEVQKRLEANAVNFTRRGRRSKVGHLLGKLARCYDCGNRFNVSVQGSQSNESYFRMYRRARGPECHFAGRSFSGREVNAQMHQLFGRFSLREDWRQTVIDKYISKADVEGIQARRVEIIERIKRLDLRYDVGSVSEAKFRTEYLRLNEELDRLQLPETDDVTRAGELLDDFPQIWSDATRHEHNELLLLMLDAVYIDPENRRLVSIQPKGAFADPIREMLERSDLRLEEDYEPPFSRNFSEHASMSPICFRSRGCINARDSGWNSPRTRAWRATQRSTRWTRRTYMKPKSGASRRTSSANG